MERLDIETTQKIDAKVNELVERFADDVDSLAKVAARVFPSPHGDRGNDKGKTQMNNLERVGLSAARFGDVVAFVKRQTGRMDDWNRQAAGGASLGERTVALLLRLHEEVLVASKDATLAPHRQTLAMRVVGVTLRNLNSAFLYERVTAAQ